MEIENIKVIRDSIGVAIVPGDEILFNYDGKDVIGKYIGLSSRNTLQFESPLSGTIYNVKPSSINKALHVKFSCYRQEVSA